GRGLNLGDLPLQKGIELTECVVRATWVMTVLTVVGDDPVKVTDVAGGERRIERARVVGGRRSRGKVILDAGRIGTYRLVVHPTDDPVVVDRRVVVRAVDVLGPVHAGVDEVRRSGRPFCPPPPRASSPGEL